jgi:hypothetical protein
MHSQQYVDKVNGDSLEPNGSYWENRAHILFGRLIEKIGEQAAEAWLDAHFPDNSTASWKNMAVATEHKLQALEAQPVQEETDTQHRMDVEAQRYAGTN